MASRSRCARRRDGCRSLGGAHQGLALAQEATQAGVDEGGLGAGGGIALGGLHGLIDQEGAKKIAAVHELIDLMARLHDILSPAQRQKLVALVQEHLTAR